MLGKVEICGVNTAKLPSLSAQETDELLRRVKEGDQSARERLVEGNLRLVLSVIQRFSNRGENADDLFQVGCVGLLKAIDNFDVNLNLRFSTYGVPMILGEIRRYLRDNSSIRVSRSMRDTAYRVLQVREKLQRENQREPCIETWAVGNHHGITPLGDGGTALELACALCQIAPRGLERVTEISAVYIELANGIVLALGDALQFDLNHTFCFFKGLLLVSYQFSCITGYRCKGTQCPR